MPSPPFVGKCRKTGAPGFQWCRFSGMMHHMTFDELVLRLNSARHGELRRIERETGVNYGTIREIKDGQTKNPRIDTFNNLCAWFERNEKQNAAA
jgi:hypothetical protein